MKSKKGIEPVIATVLLIVITIAVVGVLVAFLYPYIKGMMDKETACANLRVEIDQTGTFTNDSGTWVMVGYSTGNANQTRVVVTATGIGETKSNSAASNMLGINEAKTFKVDVKNATKVGAIPYTAYNGKEYMCDGGKAELTIISMRII
jgi:flagellin-like protein